MKVIAINGSPNKNGNTACALDVMAEEFKKQGIDTEIVHVGGAHLHGCIACGYCASSDENQCVFKEDLLNETVKKMRAADGLVLASPTYYAGIAGAMKAFLDRAFFSSSYYFRYKVATSIAVVRRSGGLEVLHQLNNYLHLAETVLPPTQYWAVAHGMAPREVLQDGEGIQTIRKDAMAMAWLLKIIEAGKGTMPPPPDEERVMTNFIR